MDQIAVGTFIRTRRDALQPEDVGLRRGPRRRTTGLRREEVADLADMSSDYLARLERGAGPQPSVQMVNALARALRLNIDERDHLLLLAGHPAPSRSGSSSHVSPGLMRILDRLTDTPAQVMGSVGETLAQNVSAIALLGDHSHFKGAERSAAYRWFTDSASRTIYPAADHDHHSRFQVSQLRASAARLGPSSAAAELVHRIQERSAEFAALWDENQIGVRNSEEKRFVHPEVGELSLYCQVVLDPDQMQTLLVFTATPGTESADKAELLNVVGTANLTSRKVGSS
ncbi:helix-turn-helix transcriptional regulator [Specibacter sp. AOP5-B1-6]|uniref:helix-turn-helix transcriptional regulator n=1 Tax=Specibacter sp. AOP5-B1-6 TaxID=3457653 RepID=UPI00402BE326